MSVASVTKFLTAAKQDEDLRQKLKAAMDAESCVEIGQGSGYDFTTEELQIELDKMPSEEVAKIINPGVAPREHIQPR